MRGIAARREPSGLPRAGRLLDTPDGLLDLATGLPAHLTCTAVPAADMARLDSPDSYSGDVTAAAGTAGQVCVDGWLTQDWLGRWQLRQIWVPLLPGIRRLTPARAPALVSNADIGITRVVDADAWLALAAEGRRQGLVPIHASLLSYVIGAVGWPPLLVGVRSAADASTVADVLGTTGHRAPRLGVFARLPDLDFVPPASVSQSPCGGTAGRFTPLRGVADAARARHVRRAWAALGRASAWPSLTWIPPVTGGRTAMTHLELLDVSTRIEDLRRDEDALVAACRAAREHTRADHTAIVVSRGSELVIVATDGTPRESPLAWRQLCRDDAPRDLVATDGWHTASHHDRDDGGRVWVGGRWPAREQGAGLCELLSVFARIVAPRVALPAPRPSGTPGLEDTLIGDSTVMQDVRAQIALAARAPFPVLIRGESGCGKELAARAIHALGQRRHRRCAAINCAALPDELIESELFGHVRGAFTGAATDRAGLFDDADGGTLFLDEVGELGARAQAKLLRVLQDGEVRRVGENHARRVDVRVIAATNVSLEDAVRRGTFRADLFYRLDVVRVRMPALRERREDIPRLAQHFWHECTARVGSRARLDGRALDVLARHDWPGNVRQLQNTLAALAVRVPPRGRVGLDDLAPEVRRHEREIGQPRGGLDAARREFEATYVREALSRAGGRPSAAARDLGVTRQGLSKLVRRLGLDESATGSRLP